MKSQLLQTLPPLNSPHFLLSLSFTEKLPWPYVEVMGSILQAKHSASPVPAMSLTVVSLVESVPSKPMPYKILIRHVTEKAPWVYDMMEFPISFGWGTWRWCQLLVFQRLESLKKGSEFPELFFFFFQALLTPLASGGDLPGFEDLN